MTDTSVAKASKTDADSATGKPVFWRVVLTHPNHNGRTVFRSVSETRARNWLMGRCPRGSEMHLVAPDGTAHSYEHERVGENGTDAERWDSLFNPDDWIPVDQAPPPGESEWADKEG